MVRTLCAHLKRRSRCKECGGGSICVHQRQRSQCKDCGGSSICPHQRQRHICKECGGSSICVHQKKRSFCKECGGGSICVHQRQRSQCKDCGGGSICIHQKRRSECKDCGGGSICIHQRQRSQCKECGGGSICIHQKIRSRCKDCGGGSICVHQKRRSICKECQEIRINQVDIGSLFIMADSKKRSRDDFKEEIQLALALSLPSEMILPEVDDTEDNCGGSCLAGLFEFTGDPSEKPSLTLPNGGWAYTPCCHTPVHYGCMGKHLNPSGKIVESSSGPVKINLCCPFCKQTISRSTSRMLTA